MESSRSSLSEAKRSNVSTGKGCWESTSLTVKILVGLGGLFAAAVSAFVVILIFKYKAKPTLEVKTSTEIVRPREISTWKSPEWKTITNPTSPPPTDGQYKVCSTDECQTAATLFLNAGNFSSDPCDDFHEFVCGNFIKSAKIPDNVFEAGITTEFMIKRKKHIIALLGNPMVKDQRGAIDNARAFYQGCVSIDKIDAVTAAKQLKSELKKMGGMPLLKDTNYNPKLKWQERVARLTGQYSAKVLFPVITSPKQQQPSQRVLTIEDQEFETRLEYLKKTERKKYRDAYKLTIETTLCLLISGKCKGKEKKTVTEEIQKFINFEATLMSIKPTFNFAQLTVQKMKKDIPKFRISSFLKALQVGSQNVNTNKSTKLYIRSLASLKRIAELLNKTDAKTVANYIGVRFLLYVLRYSPPAFRKNKEKYDILVGSALKHTRIEEICVDAATMLFPQTVARLFVKEHLHQKAKSDIQSLLEQLKKITELLLQENEWMDPTTKEAAIKKIRNMKTYSAYPEWILDDQKLNEIEGLPKPFDKKSVLLSIFAVEKQRRKEELNLSLPTKEWYSSPVEENEAYLHGANAVMFYAGDMQPPIYTPNAIEALNYGAAGFLAGHEIIHGFDNGGSRYDYEGKAVNWWKGKTRKTFLEKQKCFVQQYGSIRDNQTKLKLNGKNLVAENIADNGGLSLAYEAYMATNPKDERLPRLEEFSHQKLFFMSYARQFCKVYRNKALITYITHASHAPDRYRVYLPPSNHYKFAEVFNCQPGTKMNPQKRCEMW